MKYLLLLLIAVVVLWRFRSKSPLPSAQQPQDHAEAAAKAVEMQACAHCGVHMPAADMVAGAHGRYCSAQHRTQAER